ncbi:MAG: protein kinase [Planctomycetes bacterium]|nr:protein kinase [Planctomycetota bacterium]
MPTPLMTGDFWQQLAKSGLLSPERAASIGRQLVKRGITADDMVARLLVRQQILTQYQADRLLEGRSRGFFFDQYKVLDLLGAGGMGWVYRAADTNTQEIVAMKVLLDRLKEDRGMLARFQQEARAGLVLDHPHIVRTRATGSAGGMLYMILDFVEGPSLLELLLRRKRLPWSLACDVARQAALGLHHAHQSGWVHRDVKPQNLLIDHNGFVKLLDFGLAMKREGEGGDEFSMAMIFGHECIGTPAFMAPEQARDSLTADARSDVYGLGCTLYAALVGDTPFPLRNPHEVVKAHQTQAPRSVREFVPDIPQPVADIVMKMLAKNPDDRFPTAAAVAEALAQWSKSEPVEFDFPEILAERTQNALDRVAELHKSRPIPSGSASSTTRLSRLSSVAQSSGELPTFSAGKSPQFGRDATGQRGAGRPEVTVIDHQTATSVRDGQSPEFQSRHHGKVLVPVAGGATISLLKQRILIGRAADCDLQVPDTSVSSRHAELEYDGVCWWITDLKSRNGTNVNGKPVHRRQIVEGDVIGIGNSVRLRFEDVCEPGEEKPRQRTRSLSKLVLIAIGLAAITAIGLGLAAIPW